MTINTGGVDVTQQTGGVGINLVTKSGTDRFKGSTRYYVTDEKLPVEQHHRRRCARRARPRATRSRTSRTTASKLGGPIRKGRAWVWGSFGKQIVDVGVIGFYKPTPECQAFKTAVGRARGVDRGRQRLPQHRPHAAADDQPQGRSAAVQGEQADPVQQLRQEGAQRPRRRRTSTRSRRPRRRRRVDKSFGKYLWNTGPNPTYKFGDQWVVSDRLLLDLQYAHVGNNFTLGLQSPDLRDGAADAHRLDRPERPLGG